MPATGLISRHQPAAFLFRTGPLKAPKPQWNWPAAWPTVFSVGQLGHGVARTWTPTYFLELAWNNSAYVVPPTALALPGVFTPRVRTVNNVLYHYLGGEGHRRPFALAFRDLNGMKGVIFNQGTQDRSPPQPVAPEKFDGYLKEMMKGNTSAETLIFDNMRMVCQFPIPSVLSRGQLFGPAFPQELTATR
jgi:hypothetical protein